MCKIVFSQTAMKFMRLELFHMLEIFSYIVLILLAVSLAAHQISSLIIQTDSINCYLLQVRHQLLI